MSLKRPYQYVKSSEPSSSKRSRYGDTITPGRVRKPRRKYRDHTWSGVGWNFHSLPYPLSLLHYDSWNVLHHGTDGAPEQPPKCSKCYTVLPQPTSHQHKLFLVAERLSWQNGTVSYKQRERNERLNWGVNYKLGIVEPAVEEDAQEPGGTHSRTNPWHPFQTEHEMETSMGLIAKATILSESSWKVWLEMTEAVPPSTGVLARISDSGPGVGQRVCIDLPAEPTTIAAIHVPDVKGNASASVAEQHSRRQSHAGTKAKPESLESAMTNFTTLKLSYRTLPEFYSTLDKIERTSYVGARYLEAYAEYLHNTDSCSDCWFGKRMMPEEELEELEEEIRMEMGGE